MKKSVVSHLSESFLLILVSTILAGLIALLTGNLFLFNPVTAGIIQFVMVMIKAELDPPV